MARRGTPGSAGVGKAAMLVLGILLASAAVEAVARLLWTPPRNDQLVDEQAGPDGRRTIGRNATGSRDRDEPSPRRAGVERVLLLGDSFTSGSGGVDQEKVFASLIEKRLSAEPRRSVEVLNAGRPGSPTGDWLATLRRVGPVFRPEVVLIVFFLRDGTRRTAGEGFLGPIRSAIAARNRDSWLYHHVFAWRWWRDRMDRREVSDRFSREIVLAYTGSEEQTAEWRAARGNLRAIRDEAAALGARAGLVVFPILADFGPGYPFREVCDLVEEAGIAAGLPTLDLLPAFRGEDAPSLWVSPLDQHPNERGHEIAAEAILPFVRSLLAEGPARGAPDSEAPGGLDREPGTGAGEGPGGASSPGPP